MSQIIKRSRCKYTNILNMPYKLQKKEIYYCKNFNRLLVTY